MYMSSSPPKPHQPGAAPLIAISLVCWSSKGVTNVIRTQSSAGGCKRKTFSKIGCLSKDGTNTVFPPGGFFLFCFFPETPCFFGGVHEFVRFVNSCS